MHVSLTCFRCLGPAELAVTFFRFNPEHRGYILEEVVSGALTNMAAGKHVPRNLMVQVGRVLRETAGFVCVLAEDTVSNEHGMQCYMCAKIY